MHEPVKRLPRLASSPKGGEWKPLLGIFVVALVGAALTVALLRLVPLLLPLLLR